MSWNETYDFSILLIFGFNIGYYIYRFTDIYKKEVSYV